MTIKSNLSAIRAVLKIEGVNLKEDLYLLNTLTRVCKFKNDQLVQRLPIKKVMLHKLLGKLIEVYAIQPYLLRLYVALLITTYAGLFRIGEVTNSPHVVRAKDVEIATNKKKLKFVLWTSKTHNRGNKPQIIKIKSEPAHTSSSSKKSSEWCPFYWLHQYFAVRPNCLNDDEQFFVFSDNSPVTPQQFREVLKKTLQIAGYDCESPKSRSK